MVNSPNIIACNEVIALMQASAVHLQPVASLQQLRDLFAIDAEAYQECSLDFDTFEQWWKRYNSGSRVLLINNQIAASVGIYPLEPEQFSAFEQGQIPEKGLRPVLTADCERDPVSTWYASGIVVAPALRGWGSPLSRLLRGGLSAWLDSGHLRYPIEVLAIAEYPEGAKLLELLSFSKVQSAVEMPDRCDLYKARFNSYSEAIAIVKRVRS